MTTSDDLQTAGPSTVFGVTLEPGERVVYFHRVEPGWQKPVFIIGGLLTFWTILGLVFFVAGLMSTTTCYVVTTRRFLQLTRKKAEQIGLDDVVGVRIRYKGNHLDTLALDGKPGTTGLSIDPMGKKELLPLVQRFAADRRVLESMPTTLFDAGTSDKPAR